MASCNTLSKIPTLSRSRFTRSCPRGPCLCLQAHVPPRPPLLAHPRCTGILGISWRGQAGSGLRALCIPCALPMSTFSPHSVLTLVRCCITNHSKTRWLKMRIFFCSWVLWGRDLDKAQQDGWPLSHCDWSLSWEDPTAGMTCSHGMEFSGSSYLCMSGIWTGKTQNAQVSFHTAQQPQESDASSMAAPGSSMSALGTG